MAKKIYGIHFAGFWVNQITRVVCLGGDAEDDYYCPAQVSPDGYLVPAEYAIASNKSVAVRMFFKYFDYVRKKVDPTNQLVLVCEPTIIEYGLQDVLANPPIKKAILECCMASYYGWTEDNLAKELADAVNGTQRYEDLF